MVWSGLWETGSCRVSHLGPLPHCPERTQGSPQWRGGFSSLPFSATSRTPKPYAGRCRQVEPSAAAAASCPCFSAKRPLPRVWGCRSAWSEVSRPRGLQAVCAPPPLPPISSPAPPWRCCCGFLPLPRGLSALLPLRVSPHPTSSPASHPLGHVATKPQHGRYPTRCSNTGRYAVSEGLTV